ncbi:MAG: hypothetical protein AAFV93_08010 [Chloroflexota bacterium]
MRRVLSDIGLQFLWCRLRINPKAKQTTPTEVGISRLLSALADVIVLASGFSQMRFLQTSCHIYQYDPLAGNTCPVR